LGTCPPPAEGTARLYALNYLSGAGVTDLNGDGTIDRYVSIGGGIPSEVVVVIREGGVSGLIGTSGGASAGTSDTAALGNPYLFYMDGKLRRYSTFWHDD